MLVLLNFPFIMGSDPILNYLGKQTLKLELTVILEVIEKLRERLDFRQVEISFLINKLTN